MRYDLKGEGNKKVKKKKKETRYASLALFVWSYVKQGIESILFLIYPITD